MGNRMGNLRKHKPLVQRFPIPSIDGWPPRATNYDAVRFQSQAEGEAKRPAFASVVI
jgi:hypothetical protein